MANMDWTTNVPEVNWNVVLNVGGIILGGLSAVLIARGLLLRSPLDVFRELEAFGVWDFTVSQGASRLLRGWLAQRLDTFVGCAILFGAFAGQGVAMLAPDVAPRRPSAVAAAALFLPLAIVGYFGLTRRIDARATSQARSLYEGLRPRADPSWQPMIDERLRELEDAG
jgi:hypothetical protein